MEYLKLPHNFNFGRAEVIALGMVSQFDTRGADKKGEFTSKFDVEFITSFSNSNCGSSRYKTFD